jgi:hypothetical protein
VNVTVLQVQIVIVECPCAKVCRLHTPPDELAERLRKEMRYGRDAGREPAFPRGAIDNFAAAFQASL